MSIARVRTSLLAVLAALLFAPGCAYVEDGFDSVPDPDDGDGGEADDDSAPTPGTYVDPFVPLDGASNPEFSGIREVELRGNLVVFCTAIYGLQVYDGSDPTDLKWVEQFLPLESWPGRCQYLAMEPGGDLLYMSNGSDMVNAASFIVAGRFASDGGLTELDTYFPEFEAAGMAVHGEHLLVAAHGAGLRVLRRYDSGALEEVGANDDPVNALTVRMCGEEVACVADGDGGLLLFDVSDPTLPKILERVELPGTVMDLDVHDGRAYASLGIGGVAVVDVTDPLDARVLASLETPESAQATAFDPDTGMLFVADWTRVLYLDASDPEELRMLGEERVLDPAGEHTRTLGIAARGGIVFSSNWKEIASYAYTAGEGAPNLVVSPVDLYMPRLPSGEEEWDSVTVSNLGSRPLVLTEVRAVAPLTVEADVPMLIVPGGSAVIDVGYAPEVDGAFEGAIQLVSDDPDQPVLDVRVLASGGTYGIGDDVSHLAFLDVDGGVIELADLAGEVVLLDYFATW